eukprot:748878-Hanusia_phi.AAC.1
MGGRGGEGGERRGRGEEERRGEEMGGRGGEGGEGCARRKEKCEEGDEEEQQEEEEERRTRKGKGGGRRRVTRSSGGSSPGPAGDRAEARGIQPDGRRRRDGLPPLTFDKMKTLMEERDASREQVKKLEEE